MFDSHCHLDATAFDVDRAEVLARARRDGLLGVLVPGLDPSQWCSLPGFCRQDPLLRFGLGVHPWHVRGLPAETLDGALRELPDLVASTRCVAIGECGLDAPHARRGGAPLARQRQVLTAHLALARASGLPLILHCVGAHGMLLDMIEAGPALPRGGVLHSYSGPAELVPRYAKLGLSFSFAGVITRPEAKRPRRALQAVPLQRLLVESDGPGQAMRDSAAARAEPCHARHVLEAAAALRAEPYSLLARETTAHALSLFGGTM